MWSIISDGTSRNTKVFYNGIELDNISSLRIEELHHDSIMIAQISFYVGHVSLGEDHIPYVSYANIPIDEAFFRLKRDLKNAYEIFINRDEKLLVGGE